jgi:hypothetical protein
MESLTRLAKLMELEDALRRKQRNWWPAVVFLATVTGASILLFARVRETEIELDAAVDGLSFESPKEQVLTRAMRLANLGVAGLEGVRLPLLHGKPLPAALSPALPARDMLLSPAPSPGRSGSTTLAPLPLAAATRVGLDCSDGSRQFRLSLKPSAVELAATLDGPVTVGFSGAPALPLDFAVPKGVSFHGGAGELDLDLTFAGLPQSPFSPLLAARNLSFVRIDEYPGQDRTMIRRLSTIFSGTLHFESLGGGEHHLRPGEQLTFERSQGSILALELAERQVNLKFHGRVSGITTGTGEGRRSLMPTWLEWLEARHGLSLFWGASLYLFALVAGALRWWGIRI